MFHHVKRIKSKNNFFDCLIANLWFKNKAFPLSKAVGIVIGVTIGIVGILLSILVILSINHIMKINAKEAAYL